MLFAVFFGDIVDFIPVISEKRPDDSADIRSQEHHDEEAYVDQYFDDIVLDDIPRYRSVDDEERDSQDDEQVKGEVDQEYGLHSHISERIFPIAQCHSEASFQRFIELLFLYRDQVSGIRFEIIEDIYEYKPYDQQHDRASRPISIQDKQFKRDEDPDDRREHHSDEPEFKHREKVASRPSQRLLHGLLLVVQIMDDG